MKHFKNLPEKVDLSPLLRLELISNERDYQEQMIDARLKWISENDPHSTLKNFNMVDCQSEIDFFMFRQQELEQEKEQYIHQLMFQMKRDIHEVQTAEPPELAISLVGPDYAIQERIEKYRVQETSKQQAIYHEEVQLITDKYTSLKQQCKERIDQARANYQAAFRIWQEERSWMKDQG